MLSFALQPSHLFECSSLKTSVGKQADLQKDATDYFGSKLIILFDRPHPNFPAIYILWWFHRIYFLCFKLFIFSRLCQFFTLSFFLYIQIYELGQNNLVMEVGTLISIYKIDKSTCVITFLYNSQS